MNAKICVYLCLSRRISKFLSLKIFHIFVLINFFLFDLINNLWQRAFILFRNLLDFCHINMEIFIHVNDFGTIFLSDSQVDIVLDILVREVFVPVLDDEI